MPYFVARRRPAQRRRQREVGPRVVQRRDAIAQMIADGREPRIALRFVRMPLFLPIDLRTGSFVLAEPYRFRADDAIGDWMRTHMELAETFDVNGEPWVELWVR